MDSRNLKHKQFIYKIHENELDQLVSFYFSNQKYKLTYNGKAVNSKYSSLENYFKDYRPDTIGEMFDKAVDKTLGNKDFMKFAEDKKG